MRSVRFALAGAAVAALTSVSAPALAHGVVNGDFESVVCASAAGYCNYDSSTAPAGFGWDIDQNVDVVIGNTSWGSAHDGNQFLDLVGFGSQGGISQDLALSAGDYTLSFWYRSNNTFGAGDASADVSIGSLTAQITSASTDDWRKFTQTFHVSSGSTLAFNELNGGGNGGIFLDGISVAGVPEPATWAMLLLGVGGIGAAMRAAQRRQFGVPATA